MKKVIGAVVLVVAIGIAFVASIAIGTRDVPPGEVLNALLHGSSSPDGLGVLVHSRLIRTVLGLVVGLAIGAAGALAQGHTRNPLADPGLLGINAGAACAVVTGVFVFGTSGPLANTVLALAGAFVAAAAVFGLSTVTGSSPLTLVLAGAGLSACLTAVSSALVLSDGATLDTWRFWNVGAVSGRGADVLWTTLPFIVVGLVLAFAGGWFLNLMSLGDDMATALGGRVGLIRVTGIIGIALLAGAATAACGPIVFLGLIVPHIARAFTGPDYRWIVPYSALAGALLILVCDVIGRVIARPGEAQVSVVLALIGGPMLMIMVRRRRLPTV
ncbi:MULTISPECIES: FecCD family ABC transporter permease [Gordonia]|uniref:Iron chelate uptake ABC transporter family permease subunit n=2 Tax=Gordonia TaxID=2053 RepID=A0ABN3HJR0_9ACTN|nr:MULTISPECIES: iron chelate uptake ABC transporter family permease subunit [Gordonia]AUH67925.1 iron ABC transporter permease [Gordonia sp. YC-JH1]KJR07954.1 iron ABC transporter permease [Gordonia sihwensis]KXT58668.1 iron ABC transporter permease [Gordonia sp. QH-12]MBY4571415.1 iron ABC transporter permease [Gordonia sihwensis]WFN92360.1 iron chelate uptake ABC transporter family permease subunit [Gordonia sihwensis]